MEGRVELKYLVSNELLDEIRDDLRPYMTADPIGGRQGTGEYTVRSIYYDTPRLHCYDAKLDGIKCRDKYRIRGYDRPDDKSIVFLEIKRKYENFIEKYRAPLLRKHLESFLACPDIDQYIIQSSGTAQERRDAERFLYHYYRDSLLPMMLVVYDREAFLGRFDPSLRLTFDKALRRAALPPLETLYDEEPLQVSMNGAWIFEVKFFRGALPGFVRSIITRHRLPRLALSKYAICMESHPVGPMLPPQRAGQYAAASRPI